MPFLKPALYCLALLGAGAACEALSPTEPLPENAQPLAAVPPEFQKWWQATEACSGQAGRIEMIQWYVVPGARTIQTPDGPKVGWWSHSAAGVRIVLAGNYADNELVVRHEMLHALLDRAGHPPQYFTARCQLTWDSWDH